MCLAISASRRVGSFGGSLLPQKAIFHYEISIFFSILNFLMELRLRVFRILGEKPEFGLLI